MIRACILCFTLLVVLHNVDARRPIVCYYASWSHWRPGRGQFTVGNIDPFLCTHLVYSFFGVNEFGAVTVLDQWLDLDSGLGNIRRFNELRNRNPNLKTLAAIGGATVDPNLFSQIAASPSLRIAFAQNVRDFCLAHGFDGVDIGWEFPTVDDRGNFVLMLSELAGALRPHRLLLTAALGASATFASISYDIIGIVPHLDFINLMTYDYNGAWANFTGHNAPLFAGPSDFTDFQQMLNVQHSVDYWLSQGAPASKLVLGVPAYGRSFTLANPAVNGLRAPADGPGLPGPYTSQHGYIAYHEICGHFLAGSNWHRVWEATQRIPYAFFDRQWIGYDDRESIVEKCSFANSRQLAGIMMWSIDTDDFHGYCGTSNILLRTINECLV